MVLALRTYETDLLVGRCGVELPRPPRGAVPPLPPHALRPPPDAEPPREPRPPGDAAPDAEIPELPSDSEPPTHLVGLP